MADSKTLTPADTVIELRDIVVHYGDALALNKVSLSVRRGSTVSIIGANGAGKTTTLRVISGILTPSSGALIFEGEQLRRFDPADFVPRGIAHSPEGRRIFPYMTVEENLSLGAYAVRDASLVRQRREMLLDIFPLLRERAKQLGGSLSGGQQQMLAIARAFMSGPKILLLDEPTLGLAPLVTKDIADMIRLLRKEGVTIVLVEQNAEIAFDLADHVYVLSNGSVVAAGSPSEMRASQDIKSAYLGG